MSLLTLQNQLTEFETLSNGQQGELDDIKKNISDIQESLEHFEDFRPALDLQNDQIHSLSSQIDNFNETITQVATDVAKNVATEVATNIATDIATGIATGIATDIQPNNEATVVNENVTNVDEMTRELLKKEIYSEVLAQIQSDLPAMVEKERKKSYNDFENVSYQRLLRNSYGFKLLGSTTLVIAKNLNRIWSLSHPWKNNSLFFEDFLEHRT